MTCSRCVYAERWHLKYPCNRCSGNAYLTVRNYFVPQPKTDRATDDWLAIDTIPTDRYVEVKTVEGLVRLACIRWFRRADKYGPKRIECFCKNSSNVWAIAWREP